MTGLTESEKEKQRLLVPFDIAKEFIEDLTVFLEERNNKEEWKIKSHTLSKGKENLVKVNFELLQEAIEEKIEQLDKAQKKLDNF